MTKHTAAWQAKRYEQAGNGEWLWCVYDENGMLVAKRLTEEKALRIVRSCNAHDDLVNALKEAKLELTWIAKRHGGDGRSPSFDGTIAKIDAALIKERDS